MIRAREPMRLQRALARGGDTRALKRECREGNRYALAYLARRGLHYDSALGVIVRGA